MNITSTLLSIGRCDR